jgi:hypothetical protein
VKEKAIIEDRKQTGWLPLSGSSRAFSMVKASRVPTADRRQTSDIRQQTADSRQQTADRMATFVRFFKGVLDGEGEPRTIVPRTEGHLEG